MKDNTIRIKKRDLAKSYYTVFSLAIVRRLLQSGHVIADVKPFREKLDNGKVRIHKDKCVHVFKVDETFFNDYAKFVSEREAKFDDIEFKRNIDNITDKWKNASDEEVKAAENE